MDHVKATKATKAAKSTIKLSEIDFTPVYIALLVILISIGNPNQTF